MASRTKSRAVETAVTNPRGLHSELSKTQFECTHRVQINGKPVNLTFKIDINPKTKRTSFSFKGGDDTLCLDESQHAAICEALKYSIVQGFSEAVSRKRAMHEADMEGGSNQGEIEFPGGNEFTNGFEE